VNRITTSSGKQFMEKPHCVRLRALAPAVFVLFMLGVTSGQAAGDAANGAAVFVRQCALCHTINKDGPNRSPLVVEFQLRPDPLAH
jgi:cytochrome c2